MIATLSDHHSFGAARKSLLISSCLVVLVSAAKIQGDTIQILGLGLSFSKPNLIFLLRIVSAYLFWVFFWISLTEYYPKIKSVLIANHQRMIENSLQKTRQIDDDVYSHGEEDHGNHDPEGWWKAHYEYEMKKKASISRLEKVDQLFAIGRLIVVDVLPVTVLAGFAIFEPNYAASFLVLN